MTEEKAAKLRLKRKRCVIPAPQGAPEVRLQTPPPALDLRQGSTGSWFDEIDLTAAELMWKGVLRAVYPDLRSMGWGAVPALPYFHPKLTGKEKQKTASAEVFVIGEQNFQWVPLPNVLPGDAAEQPSVIHAEVGNQQQNPKTLLESITVTSPKQGLHVDTTDQLDSRLLVLLPNQKKPLCNESSTKNNKEPETSPGSSERAKEQQTLQKGSTKKAKEPQTLQKGSTKKAKELQTSQITSIKIDNEPQQSQIVSTNKIQKLQTAQKHSFPLWPTVISKEKNLAVQKIQQEPKVVEKLQRGEPQSNDVVMVNAPEEGTSAQLQEIQESIDKSADAIGSLENCPICLMQFSKRFSQLDMDSHLAQCLSETTVDMVW